MKRIYTTFLTMFVVALLASAQALAQDSGDFRTAADGDWSASATWETFDGTDWNGADSAPDGSENITILAEDSVGVDIAVSVSGQVTVEGDDPGTGTGGILAVTDGSLTFEDGGVYEHARDAGDIPEATWNSGSTVLFTGVVADEPGNSDQDFHHLTWNNENQVENISLGWDIYTLAGDLTVLHTNGQQFRMTSANTDAAREITIEGNVIVDGENAEFTTTGSGDVADYEITVMGDVEVINGGFLSVSRGSGGRAVWTLHGDLTVTNGRLGESDIDKHGQKRSFVFAGGSPQIITGSEVDTESTLYYEIATGSEVTVADGSFPVDSLTVQGDLTLEGELVANGAVVLDNGTLTVADGGTYNHAHNAGEIPNATWEVGSTVLLTGIQSDDPDNADQDFYHFTWNNPDQIENINIGWDDYSLRGDISVFDTGGNQFRLTSANEDPRNITIEGNVIVDGENAEFTTTGSGDLADYNITVLGNVEVTNGGFLSASRGSSGRAVWSLHGDLTVTDAQLGDSQDHDQTRSFVFVADTTVDGEASQNINISNISYDGAVYFHVSDSSGVLVNEGSQFAVEDTLFNAGIIEVEENAELIFADGSVYQHVQDGGNVPTATWEEGSTALFTHIVTSGPGNASQDFYNLVLNSPDNIENNDFDMDGNTINGDIEVLSTGSARLYLTNPDSFEDREITIMGDVYVDVGGGAFTTQGTGSGESSVTIHHYGNITVDSGNFSIGRGSGPLVYWNMYEGDFIFNAGETQNSNPRTESAFIFTGDEETTHTMTVSGDVEIQHLPVVVDTVATLDIGTSSFDDSGDNFTVRSGATLASADTSGFETNLGLSGSGDATLSLSSEAHYVLNGSVPQETGFELPLNVASLTIDNEAGVTQSRGITIHEFLRLSAGVFDNTIGFTLAEGAVLILDGGSLLIPIDGVPSVPPSTDEIVWDFDNTAFLNAWVNGENSSQSFAGSEDAVEGDSSLVWTYTVDPSLEWGGSADIELEYGNYLTDLTDFDGMQLSYKVNSPVAPSDGGATFNVKIFVESSGEEVEEHHYTVPGVLSDDSGEWQTAELLFEDFAIPSWLDTFDGELYPDQILRIQMQVIVGSDGSEVSGELMLDNLEPYKTDVSNDPVVDIPQQFALNQNYPNPFNPSTTISYELPEAVDVTLTIYDVTGRQVAQLVNQRQSAGSHEIEWNASNFATGMYIYRIQAGDFTAVRKLTLVK